MIKVNLMLLAVNRSNSKRRSFQLLEFRATWVVVHILNYEFNIPLIRQEKYVQVKNFGLSFQIFQNIFTLQTLL